MPSTVVIHPGALGDVLLAVPALREIRASRPDDRLVLAAQPRIGALLTVLGVVDEWLSFDTLGLETLFVDAGEPTVVEPLRRAAQIICWFGGRDPVFVRRLRELVPRTVVASPAGDGELAVWEYLLHTVATVPGQWSDPLEVPAALQAEGRQALLEAGWDERLPLVIVHPGAGGLGKRWPTAGFARVLAEVHARRSLTIVVHEGPADHAAAGSLATMLDQPVLRDPSLPCLAGALRHASAYLGNDSGVSHLAAATGTPSLVLFDAGKLAWRPWNAAARLCAVTMPAVVADDVAAVGAALEDVLG